MLPVAIRNKASVRLVNKFTPEDIEQLHAEAKG
jgi:hypothetical protein